MRGLQGLPGLNRLNAQARNNFIYKYRAKLEPYARYGDLNEAADILYNNSLFINRYGRDAFDKSIRAYNGDGAAAYNARNAFLKHDVVSEEWWKRYNPFYGNNQRDNNKGLGAQFEHFSQMSDDAKLKLMESGYQTQTEFNDAWNKELKNERELNNSRTAGYDPTKNWWDRLVSAIASGALTEDTGASLSIDNAEKNEHLFTGEAAYSISEERRKRKQDLNDNIATRIFNNDIKAQEKNLSGQVEAVYNADKRSDAEIQKAYDETFVNKDSIMRRLGRGTAAAYNDQGEITKHLTIDDKRKALAKWEAYTKSGKMSLDQAATALDNYFKEFVADHQDTATKAGLFIKDIGDSAATYTLDKISSSINAYKKAVDTFGKSNYAYMDGGIPVDPNKLLRTKDGRLLKTKNGEYQYKTDDGNIKTAHLGKMSRQALWEMGRNSDGSVDHSILNPMYLSKVEQFGTWDEDEQKKYEELGVSPYKIAWKPGDDSHIWYDTAKMTSFGIADAVMTAIPWAAGSRLGALSEAGKLGRVGRALQMANNVLNPATRTGQYVQGTLGALGIANAYSRNTFQETWQQGLSSAQDAMLLKSQNDVYQRYATDKAFQGRVAAEIPDEARKVKEEYLSELQKNGQDTSQINPDELEKFANQQAEKNVLARYVDAEIQKNSSSKEYNALLEKAGEEANKAQWNTFVPEAVKYSLVNLFGHRRIFYKNPTAVVGGVKKKLPELIEHVKEYTAKGGTKRLMADTKSFLTAGKKWATAAKAVGSQAWGGAWTNGTDDMMVDAAERISSDDYNRYINGYNNGQTVSDTYGLVNSATSYVNGLSNSMGQSTTWNAGLVGALGSVVNANLNVMNILSLATKEGRDTFKRNFVEDYERDEHGQIILDADGKPKMRHIKWNERLGGKLGFFLQNGVLNSVYGQVQQGRDLQRQLDQVNQTLDQFHDFNDVVDLIKSDDAYDGADGIDNAKTMQFINAINAYNVLRNITRDPNSPYRMSSIVQKMEDMVETFSGVKLDSNSNTMPKELVDEKGDLLPKVKQWLGEFYSNNQTQPMTIGQTIENLKTLIKNTQKFQKAAEAYNKASESLSKIEKQQGKQFDHDVKGRLILQQALGDHWKGRLDTMKDELDDHSEAQEATGEQLIASVGGVKNGRKLAEAYDRQEAEIGEQIEAQKKKTEELKKKNDKAQKALNENSDSAKAADLKEAAKKASDAYESSVLQERHLNGLLRATTEKKGRINEALDNNEKQWKESEEEKKATANKNRKLPDVETKGTAKEAPAKTETSEEETGEEATEQVNPGSGRYAANVADDGSQKVIFSGDKEARRTLNGQQLKEAGVNLDDVIGIESTAGKGKKKAKKIAKKNAEKRKGFNGIAVDGVDMAADGQLTVHTDHGDFSGETAEKIVQTAFPEYQQTIDGVRNSNDEYTYTESEKSNKALTADEIMRLDPVTRARMLNDANQDLYSEEQKAEIEKLKTQLLAKDPNALQKIQDIADLTSKLKANAEAHKRVLTNPDAAAYQFEEERIASARAATDIYVHDVADSVVQQITNVLDRAESEYLARSEELTDADKERAVRTMLLSVLSQQNLDRDNAVRALKLIEKNKMLPAYQGTVEDINSLISTADDLMGVTGRIAQQKSEDEITAAVEAKKASSGEEESIELSKDEVLAATKKSTEWYNQAIKLIGDTINRLDRSEDVFPALEKLVNDMIDQGHSDLADIVDEVLEGMRKLNYQRDATVLEQHKERKERVAKEKAERERIEAEKKAQAEEAARKAAAAEAERRAKLEALRKQQEEEEKKRRAEYEKNHRFSLNSEKSKGLAEDEAAKAQAVIDHLNGKINGRDLLDKLGYDQEVLGMMADVDIQKEIQNAVTKYREYIVDSKLKPSTSGKTKKVPDKEVISKLTAEDLRGTPLNHVSVLFAKHPDGLPVHVLHMTEAVADYLNGEMPVDDFLEAMGVESKKFENLPQSEKENLAAQKLAPYQDFLKEEDNNSEEHPVNEEAKPISDVFTSKVSDGETLRVGVLTSADGKKAKKKPIFATAEKKGGSARATLFDGEGHNVEVGVSPKEYEKPENGTEPHELSKGGKLEFRAHSFEKTKDGTFADGHFEGSDKPTRVKLKNDTKLDDLIESEGKRSEIKTAQEIGTGIEGATITKDGSIAGQSPAEAPVHHVGEGSSATMSSTDQSTANTLGEQQNEASATSLTANTLMEIDVDRLRGKSGEEVTETKEPKIVHRKGEKEGDTLNKFFDWIKAANIHLQKIIDTELHQMLKKNPHMKVKFLAVKGEANATHDDNVGNVMFLVVDYDNKINKGITASHNEENGGVVTANGKKYLIIGTAGYAKSRAGQKALFERLWGKDGKVTKAKNEYFSKNPTERFFVSDDVTTEIVPNSLIPGFITHQLEGENKTQPRPITELISDPERNPYGIKLDQMGWLIRFSGEIGELYTTVLPDEGKHYDVMPPLRDQRRGNTFALVPASNGKYVPIYINPTFCAEIMADGKENPFKSEALRLLNLVTSPDHQTRVNAICKLGELFYFNKDLDDILTTTGEHGVPVVSFTKNGEVFATFQLDSGFDRSAFIEAFMDMNPIVQLSTGILSNPEMLKMYAESGALNTDAGILGTVGSSYSVFGLDADGKMLQPEAPKSGTEKRSSTEKGESFREADDTRVVYKGDWYTYKDGKYTLNGLTVTDADVIAQLDLNRRINELADKPESLPRERKEIFILTRGEHPEVAERNTATKHVKKYSEEESKKYIEEFDAKKEAKERDAAALEALKKGTAVIIMKTPVTITPEGKEKTEEEKRKEAEEQQRKAFEDKYSRRTGENTLMLWDDGQYGKSELSELGKAFDNAKTPKEQIDALIKIEKKLKEVERNPITDQSGIDDLKNFLRYNYDKLEKMGYKRSTYLPIDKYHIDIPHMGDPEKWRHSRFDNGNVCFVVMSVDGTRPFTFSEAITTFVKLLRIFMRKGASIQDIHDATLLPVNNISTGIAGLIQFNWLNALYDGVQKGDISIDDAMDLIGNSIGLANKDEANRFAKAAEKIKDKMIPHGNTSFDSLNMIAKMDEAAGRDGNEIYDLYSKGYKANTKEEQIGALKQLQNILATLKPEGIEQDVSWTAVNDDVTKRLKELGAEEKPSEEKPEIDPETTGNKIEDVLTVAKFMSNERVKKRVRDLLFALTDGYDSRAKYTAGKEIINDVFSDNGVLRNIPKEVYSRLYRLVALRTLEAFNAFRNTDDFDASYFDNTQFIISLADDILSDDLKSDLDALKSGKDTSTESGKREYQLAVADFCRSRLELESLSKDERTALTAIAYSALNNAIKLEGTPKTYNTVKTETKRALRKSITGEYTNVSSEYSEEDLSLKRVIAYSGDSGGERTLTLNALNELTKDKGYEVSVWDGLKEVTSKKPFVVQSVIIDTKDNSVEITGVVKNGGYAKVRFNWSNEQVAKEAVPPVLEKLFPELRDQMKKDIVFANMVRSTKLAMYGPARVDLSRPTRERYSRSTDFGEGHDSNIPFSSTRAYEGFKNVKFTERKGKYFNDNAAENTLAHRDYPSEERPEHNTNGIWVLKDGTEEYPVTTIYIKKPGGNRGSNDMALHIAGNFYDKAYELMEASDKLFSDEGKAIRDLYYDDYDAWMGTVENIINPKQETADETEGTKIDDLIKYGNSLPGGRLNKTPTSKKLYEAIDKWLAAKEKAEIGEGREQAWEALEEVQKILKDIPHRPEVRDRLLDTIDAEIVRLQDEDGHYNHYSSYYVNKLQDKDTQTALKGKVLDAKSGHIKYSAAKELVRQVQNILDTNTNLSEHDRVFLTALMHSAESTIENAATDWTDIRSAADGIKDTHPEVSKNLEDLCKKLYKANARLDYVDVRDLCEEALEEVKKLDSVQDHDFREYFDKFKGALEENIRKCNDKIQNDPQSLIKDKQKHPERYKPDTSVRTAATQTFQKLMDDRKIKMKITLQIKKKFKDAPTGDIEELAKYLKDKGVEVDAIGTTEADIKTWIDTLLNCK